MINYLLIATFWLFTVYLAYYTGRESRPKPHSFTQDSVHHSIVTPAGSFTPCSRCGYFIHHNHLGEPCHPEPKQRRP